MHDDDVAVGSLMLNDPRRLEAVEHSGLLNAENAAPLDQITTIIRDVLDVRVALVSIVTDDAQLFPSAKGLPEPWSAEGRTPLSHSFCQHVVTSGLPLQVDDAPANALVCENLAIRDLGVKAYLGAPIVDPDGIALGSLCAIDTKPRAWTEKERKVLDGFATAITMQVRAHLASARQSELNAKLVEHERRLQRISDTAPVMIAELSADLRYLFANKNYAAAFDIEPRHIIGKHPRDVIGPAAFALAEPFLARALTGETVEFDLDLTANDGASIILRANYAPELDANGHVRGIVVAAIDVTEQRKLSQLAERLDDRLSAAHQMSPDGFMVFNAIRNDANAIIDFELQYCNEAAAGVVGRPVQELIGDRLLSFLPGNKTAGLFDAYSDVVTTAKPFTDTTFYNHDNLAVWVDISAIKLGDGFAVSFRDVSERKRGEIKLADSADRLQRILDNVVAFIGVMTPDGILIEVNQPALDVAGLTRDDVIGKPFWEAYWWRFSDASQSRLKRAIDRAKTGEGSRYDVQVQISETEKIWIDFQLSPQVDANGVVTEMIPSGIDITERKVFDQHRQLLVNELNHRVKNSLATIQAMARQTIRSSDTMESFEKAFSARLNAISAAHDILVSSDDARADLQSLVLRQVEPYVDASRQLDVTGDAVLLSAECAHSVGLVLHELATNAAKHGALSVEDGCIRIAATDLGDDTVEIVWREEGGPPVAAPQKTGFGSRLIRQSIEYSLGGRAEVTFEKTGVVATLIVPTDYDHG